MNPRITTVNQELSWSTADHLVVAPPASLTVLRQPSQKDTCVELMSHSGGYCRRHCCCFLTVLLSTTLLVSADAGVVTAAHFERGDPTGQQTSSS